MQPISTPLLTLRYWHKALVFSNIKTLANSKDAIPFVDTKSLNSDTFEQKVIGNEKFKVFFKDKTKGGAKFVHEDGTFVFYAELWFIFCTKNKNNELDPILAVPIYVNEHGKIIPNIDAQPFLNSNYLEPVDEMYATHIKIGSMERYENYLKLNPYPYGFYEYDSEIEKAYFSSGEPDFKRLPNCTWADWWKYSYTMFYETYNSSEESKKIGLTQFLRENSFGTDAHFALASQYIGLEMTASIRNTFALIEQKSEKNFAKEFPLLHHICLDEFKQQMLSLEKMEENTIYHTGHMDSYDENSQQRQNFPLDPSQREVLLHFLSVPNGFPLAVSGPPGTGKTSMLKGIIATLWVNKTIESDHPQSPIVIATSQTNNATKNIITSFAEIPGRAEESLLLKRWLKGIFSYGWFFPSESRKFDSQQYQQLTYPEKTENPLLHFQGEGAALELNVSRRDAANREKINYVTCVNEFFQEKFSFVEDCTRFIHKRLKIQCQNNIPNLYKCYKKLIYIITSYDMEELEKIVEKINLIKSEIELQEKLKNEEKLKIEWQIKEACRKQDFIQNNILCYNQKILLKKNSLYDAKYYQIFNIYFTIFILKLFYLCKIKLKRNIKQFIVSEKIDIDFKFIYLSKNFDKFIDTVCQKNKDYESFKEELNLKLKLNEEYFKIYLEEKHKEIKLQNEKYEILEDYKKSYSYIMTTLKKYILTTNIPIQFKQFEEKLNKVYLLKDSHEKSRILNDDNCFESFQALLDCTIRTYNFHLAARYWEGRWLCEVFPERKKRKDFSSSLLMENLRTFCMLAPCIVSTFHSMPRLFCDNKTGERFFNEADLLIVDEAGQASLETSTASFSFAKRALIVGDVKQLEPVYNLDKEAEYSIAKNLNLTSLDKDDFFDRGILASQGNLMAVLQQKSYFTRPYTDGLMLKRHYRCVPNIIEFCNELVYDGDLIPITKNKESLFPSMGYAYHHFKASQYKGSWTNQQECNEIIDWLEENEQKIIDKYNPDGVLRKCLNDLVAIITPYKAQSYLIKNKLNDVWSRKIPDSTQRKNFIENFIIGTVHSLQGAERPIVVYSTVNHKEDGKTVFWDKKTNLLNVAVSRAKDCFLVFCNKELLFSEKTLNEKSSLPSVKLGKYLFEKGRPIYPTIAFVVESPNKVQTIQKILPRDYKVFSTCGAFRELDLEVHSSMEKSISHPVWKVVDDKRILIHEIVEFVSTFEEVILAMDNDREGELIAWHLKDHLMKQCQNKIIRFKRIRMNSIDEKSIIESIEKAEACLNKNLIHAAMIRNVFDRIYTQFINYKSKKILSINEKGPYLSRNHLSLLKILQNQKQKSRSSRYLIRLKFSFRSKKRAVFGELVNANSLLSEKRTFKTEIEAKNFIDTLQNEKWKSSPLYSIKQQIVSKSGMTTVETLRRLGKSHTLSPDKSMDILQSLYDGSAMVESSTHNPNSHRFNFGGRY